MELGTDSPPLRTTILGNLLRGRPRNASQSGERELSPSPPAQQPPSPHRRSAIGVQISASHQGNTTSAGLGLSQMLRRRRSAGAIANAAATPVPTPTPTSVPIPAPPRPTTATAGIHRIRLVPHLDSRRSLRFDAIGRDLKEGDPALRIGRFTDRSGLGLAAVNALGSNRLAFKSKVVSRAHAEIWVESSGRFMIKDTKSSSGTFLNHVRLSPANTESRPHQLKDGDILQLGVDYQGGAEDIYKSVKIRIEVGREWQAAANAFNTNALKNLKTLAATPAPKSATAAPHKHVGKSSIPDCCICLFGVTIRQALFIAPCSHTFHYKCIRPLLESHHPGFSCPLCRTFADLEEDVEVDADLLDDDDDSAIIEAQAAAAGAETEVEGDAHGARNSLQRMALGDLGAQPEEEEEEGGFDARDVEMVDVDLRGAHAHAEEESDGELGTHMVIPGGTGSPDSAGTGASADGLGRGGVGGIRMISGELGEMGDCDGDADVDGTVGGKRKR